MIRLPRARNVCERICISVAVAILALGIAVLTIVMYNVTMLIPNVIGLVLWWVLRALLSSATLLTTLFTSVRTIYDVLRVVATTYNALSILGPPFATLYNIIAGILVLFVKGVIGVACTGSASDPGWNPLINCSPLMQLLAIAPNLAQVIQDGVLLLIELFGMAGNALQAIACFDRVGAYIASGSSYSSGVVVSNCAWFCAEAVGSLDPTCYGIENLVRWLFPTNPLLWATRMAHLLSNAVDWALPFIWDVARWVAFRAGVGEVYTCPTLWCITSEALSNPLNVGAPLFKIGWGFLIEFILAPFDRIYFTIFTENVINCLAHDLCSWMFHEVDLGVVTIDVCDMLNSQGYCIANQCMTGWDKLWGWISSLISGCPCSIGCGPCPPGSLVGKALVLYNS